MAKATNRYPRRFIFHGNAVAAGVYLTRLGDDEQYIANPIDAQSSLPVIGGHSEPPVVHNPALPGPLVKVFSYNQARTMADGRLDQGGAAITKVQAAVNNVEVTNQPSKGEPGEGTSIVFKAAALSLSMLSTHPPDEDLPSIEFVDNTPLFQELSLGGLPIELELNAGLMRLSRWDDLEKSFRTDREFFDSCCDSFVPPGRKRPTFGQKLPLADGTYALSSMVRSIRWGDRTIPGHVLTQPGFGTIYFGEILLNDRERRVTMVRMQLGSGTGGQAVFVETDPNGTWWPPRPKST